MEDIRTRTGRAEEVNSLSHYTNLAALKGIVESGELWASNVAFLNDREELLHGVKCAERVLDQILNNSKLLQWREAIGDVVGRLEAGELPNTYAACFCERSDLLSQWRGYGGNEQGVCLVFDRSGLETLKSGKRSFLAPVQYGIAKSKAALRRGLQDRLLDIDQEDFVVMNEAQRRITVYEVLSELIPRFKHKSFDEELEWRLVVQHEALDNMVKFRSGRRFLVPYIALSNNEKLPIKYVRIGPGGDAERAARSITQILRVNDYEIPVQQSKVPFRA